MSIKRAKAIMSAISLTCASSRHIIPTGKSRAISTTFFRKLSPRNKPSTLRAWPADFHTTGRKSIAAHQPSMTILCLCREQHHWKLIPGYAEAFRLRGIEFFCVDDSIPFDASLEDVLSACPSRPSAIFHFESAHPLFAIGLEHSKVPTVCFHPDTYAFTDRRIRWSAVFDHAVVFHPGFEERFKRAGHPGAFLLPHAVRRDFFEGDDPPRKFEIGWVGQTSGEFYKARA